MLGPALLDAAQFPFISLKSVRISGAADAPQALVAIQIRNQTRELTIPLTLEAGDTSLRAHGMFDISQTAFGITPFSVAMGALQVVDVVKIRFDLLASPMQP
jgi:polyisoprenoid-binding protein YceI